MDHDEFLRQMDSDFSNTDIVDIVDSGLSDLDDLDDSSSEEYDFSDGSGSQEFYTGSGIMYNSDDDFDELYDSEDDDFEFSDETSSKSSIIPESLNQIATPLNVSLETLLDDSVVENTAVSNPADYSREVNGMIAACEKAGYDIANVRDINSVKATFLYVDSIVNMPQDIGAYYQSSYAISIGDLASNSALFVDQDNTLNAFKAKLLKSVHDKQLTDPCAYALNLICSLLIDVQNKKDVNDLSMNDINQSDVFNSLLTNPKINSSYVYTHAHAVRDFINTAVREVIINMQDSSTNRKRDIARRESSARQITNDIYDTIDDISKTKTSVIKRIDAHNGCDVTCTCYSCGAKTKVSALMQIVFFQKSSEVSCSAYPIKNVCSGCGSVLIFPPKIYDETAKYYYNTNTDAIKKALDKAKSFASGFSVITKYPSLDQMPLFVKCIVNNTKLQELPSSDVITEVFDAEEWKKSVDDFYKSLSLISDLEVARNQIRGGVNSNTGISSTGSDAVGQGSIKPALTYNITIPKANHHDSMLSVLAANVTQIAGVSYNASKSRALISLITYLNNNNYLLEGLQFDHVISSNAALRFVTNYQDSVNCDLNTMESSFFNNLMIIAASLDASVKIPEDKNELKKFFTEHVSQLQQLVSETNAKYAKMIDSLSKAKYALAFVPIDDYKQTSVYSIVNLIVNDPVFSIIDEICDRMIINAYAEDYFKYWVRLNFQHVPTLQRRLAVSADSGMIGKALDLIDADVFSLYGVMRSGCYFPNMTAQSMRAWEQFSRLANLVNVNNYYRFCKEAQHLRIIDFGFGPEFNNAIDEFQKQNYAEFVNVSNCTEIEYYLGSMFSHDELEKSKDVFSYLAFGRYIPIRKEGETAEDYVARFKNTDFSECYDNHNRFSRIHNLQYIFYGAAITSFKCNNFRTVSFVAGMFDSVINAGRSDALELLGVSELRYGSLLHDLKPWRFDDFNINNADVVALLNGYYFTDAESAMVETFSKLCTTYFIVENEKCALRDVFDFEECLSQNLAIEAANPDSSGMSSMVNELRTWEYTQGYTERFAGE